VHPSLCPQYKCLLIRNLVSPSCLSHSTLPNRTHWISTNGTKWTLRCHRRMLPTCNNTSPPPHEHPHSLQLRASQAAGLLKHWGLHYSTQQACDSPPSHWVSDPGTTCHTAARQTPSTTPHCFFFGGCALGAALLGGCLGAAAGALLTTGDVGDLLCACRSLRCGSGLLPLLLLAVASALCCIAVRSSWPARTAVVASCAAATPKRSRRTAPVTWPMTAREYSIWARALSCCSSCSAGGRWQVARVSGLASRMSTMTCWCVRSWPGCVQVAEVEQEGCSRCTYKHWHGWIGGILSGDVARRHLAQLSLAGGGRL
jgi:hypothetical protein